MSFERCWRCKNYHFTDSECPPPFWICNPEGDPDDWQKIHAPSARSAAEEYCYRYDAGPGDYSIIRDGGIDLILVRDEMGEVCAFSVSAETVREYTAREVKQESAEG